MSSEEQTPYQFLQQVAARLDSYQDKDEINRVMDELEFQFELLPPEVQPQCSD